MADGFSLVGKNLTRSFDKKTIFKGLDIALERGWFVALMGSSGCGKSTLLKILSGLEPPNEGDLLVAGAQVCRSGKSLMNDSQFSRFRREKIGFIFQSHQLIHELDVLENVMLPLQLQGWSKTQARNRAAEMLDRVNLLSEYLHYLPSQLSVGQQQRVGIARALIHRPEIIFADEPTASLDDENSEQVMQMILSLQEEYDTTVLMITHDPRDTKNLDRVIRFVESSGRSPWILEMEAPND